MSDTQNRKREIAEAYIELGMHEQALSEIEGMNVDDKNLSEILPIRLHLYEHFERWASMVEVAQKLTDRDPQNPDWWQSLAFGLRMRQMPVEALDAVVKGINLHPNHAQLHYDMACYRCILGDLENARRSLGHACRLDPALRADALEDPDLERFWKAL